MSRRLPPRSVSHGGGGTRAARGLRYQYARSAEVLLDLVVNDSGGGVALHVEVRPDSSDHGASEVVDYSITDKSGRVVEVAQIKSVEKRNRRRSFVDAPTALDVLIRMVSSGDADRYELWTNARLTKRTEILAGVLEASSGDPTALDEALDSAVISGATAGRIRKLSHDDRERLRRVRITSDARNTSDLLAAVERRLRGFRLSRGVTVDAEAAKMLLDSLLDTVFAAATATDPRDHTISLASVRRLVFVDSQVLALALGELSGVPAGETPWLPDIDRPEALDQLEEALRPHEERRGIVQCALVGPSGLGKTCLAALYADTHARSAGDGTGRTAYDFVLWMNAESHESAQLSVERILANPPRRLKGVEFGETETRARLRAALARFPGRWLMVFDGAVDAEVLRAWTPTQGTGDILVTSTNSASWGQYKRVEMPEMSLDEATELLCARLGIQQAMLDEAERDALERLAERLDRWPLALELCSAYMIGYSWTLADIPRYIGALRRQLVDDRANDFDAVPASYPRTLVAAVMLCVDRVRAKRKRVHLSDPAEAALGVLAAAAFTGSRSIPLLLLLEASVSARPTGGEYANAEDVSAEPVRLSDVIRLLRSESLITGISPTAPTPPEYDRGPDSPEGISISLNEIVQDVIRRWDLDDGRAAALVNSLAARTSHWLASFFDADDLTSAASLVPHASTVIAHTRDRELASPSVATLYGNFAIAQQLRGYPSEAMTLLREELQYADSLYGPPRSPSLVIDDPPAVYAKIYTQLASLTNDIGGSSGALLSQLSAAVEAITKCRDRGGLRREAVAVRGLLHAVEWGQSERRQAELLLEMLSVVERETGISDVSHAEAEVRRVNEMIMEDDDRGAADLATEILTRPDLAGPQRRQAQLLLAQALIYLMDWDRADRAVDQLMDVHAGTEEFASLAIRDGVEVALAAAGMLLVAASIEAKATSDRELSEAWMRYTATEEAAPLPEAARRALRVLENVLEPVERSVLRGRGSVSERARYFALRAFKGTIDGDPEAVRQALASYEPETAKVPTMQSTEHLQKVVRLAQEWLFHNPT